MLKKNDESSNTNKAHYVGIIASLGTGVGIACVFIARMLDNNMLHVIGISVLILAVVFHGINFACALKNHRKKKPLPRK